MLAGGSGNGYHTGRICLAGRDRRLGIHGDWLAILGLFGWKHKSGGHHQRHPDEQSSPALPSHDGTSRQLWGLEAE
ncbi:MAG: hypothetical protein ACKO26_09680 [Planctomycetota bacterium]